MSIPNTLALYEIFPNPFNPITTIRYKLPESETVIISVYDILGREVAELVHSVQKAGYHSIQWDASAYSSGSHLVKMTTTDLTQTQKILLVK